VIDPSGFPVNFIHGQTAAPGEKAPAKLIVNHTDDKPRKRVFQRFEPGPAAVHKLGHYGLCVTDFASSSMSKTSILFQQTTFMLKRTMRSIDWGYLLISTEVKILLTITPSFSQLQDQTTSTTARLKFTTLIHNNLDINGWQTRATNLCGVLGDTFLALKSLIIGGTLLAT
jgi:hypothetical protein